MRYGAVVLYYQLGERVHETLDALISQDYPPERIVLVDNASGDGVLDAADHRYPGCKVLRMEANVGYAAAMNAGAALIENDVEALLFLTHEVLMMPDCAAKLVGVLESESAVGMAGPALYLSGGSSLWSLGGVISKYGDVRHNIHLSAIRTVRWLDGACLLIRTSSFRQSGKFDEDYFLYWEDVDISLRIAASAEIRCVTDAIAIQDTASAPVYLRVRNQILCWRKNRKPFAIVMATLLALVKLVAIDCRSGSRPRARARLLGILHGFSGQMAEPSVRMVRER